MAAPEVSREAELKFSAPPGSSLPDLSHLGAWTPARHFVLEAVYLDTPAFDLQRARVTLRRRTGGDDAGWHLKRPADDGARTEEHLPLGTETPARVPAALRAGVAELVGSSALIPVATLTTHRDQSDLLAPDGRVRAHLCFDRVSASTRCEDSSWTEVEAELAVGESDETLALLGASLLGAGCTPAPHASKVGRVLASLAALGAGSIEAPGGDVVLTYAAKQVGALQSHEAGVRVDAPDAVHKSRVAARRLRSVLRRYAPLLDAEFTGHLDAELRWYGRVAGAPRDAEVLKEHLITALESLDADAVDGPVAQRLTSQLDALHATAHADLVTTLDGARYDALVSHLADLLAQRPMRDVGLLPAEFVLLDLVLDAVARVRRRYRRALARPDELERWHEVRKAAKAVRYCCEALVEPCGEDAAATAKRWEAVTEALGDAQDTVVAADLLAQLGAGAATRGEPTHTYDVLIERQIDKRAVALAAGRSALDVALADRFNWLR